MNGISAGNYPVMDKELSKYVALLFNMIRINCTPQNVPGLSKLKRKKVGSKMCG
jgi:hypothetical protein